MSTIVNIAPLHLRHNPYAAGADRTGHLASTDYSGFFKVRQSAPLRKGSFVMSGS